jgi:nickel/cobalt transporter (NicO) family protein
MVLAVLASLAQATVAVVVVHGGLGLLGMTRDAVGAAGDGWMAALGHVAMAGIGGWLIWRGARGLRRLMPGQVAGGDHHHDPAHERGHAHHDHGHNAHAHRHDHHDHGHGACDVCGHSHGPDLAQVESVTSLREAAALIAGIAVRPCSGALLLLVLTWQLGLVWTGILAAYAMGAGTALVTVGVAVLAVTGREGAWTGLPRLARARAALPLVELAVGAVLAGVALSLLWRLG